MTPNLHQMNTAELKQFISANRNDAQAFRAALEVLLSRRDPNAAYHPYPFDLADPEGEVQRLFIKKLRETQ